MYRAELTHFDSRHVVLSFELFSHILPECPCLIAIDIY